MVPPASRRVSRVPRYSGYCHVVSNFVYRAFTFYGRLSQNRSTIRSQSFMQPATPSPRKATVWPLPLSLAATKGITVVFFSCRYLDVSVHGVSPRTVMYSLYGDRGSPCRVSPFGYPRLADCMRLPVAFRSFLRPSSAPSAKAFSLCPCSLDLLYTRNDPVRVYFLLRTASISYSYIVTCTLA